MPHPREVHLVVGGGIAGLLNALLTRRAFPTAEILVVEQAPEVGGLLGKVETSHYGTFDLGMHTMTQTGLSELDNWLWSLLPEDEWHVMSGQARDISGTFFAGRLQRNAHYADLRSLDNDVYQRCVGDFFAHLQTEGANLARPFTDLESYSLARFGKEITRTVVEPIVKKTYGEAARNVDLLAGVLLRLDRVVMFDETIFRELMLSPTLRARLGFPEQRNLDLKFSSGLGSFYPKAFGIHRVIDALVKRCRQNDITLLRQTRVENITCDSGAVTSMNLRTGEKTRTVSRPAALHWTAGLVPLARHLDVFPQGLPTDAPMSTAIVNFLFDGPTEIGDLYYFYCFDAPYSTYRVTNFTAYCPGAPRAGGYPVCVELLLHEGQELAPKVLEEQALRELRAFNVLAPNTKVLFSNVKVLERGFPKPTLKNMALQTACRDSVQSLNLENLEVHGVLSKPGLFFQTDVIRDVYEKLGLQGAPLAH